MTYLVKHRSASAAHIGRGLSMSAANVRHHLSILLADGRIAMQDEVPSGKRGRPVKFYGLSDKSLGDNFALLSHALLSARLDGGSAKSKADLIRSIANSLGAPFEQIDQSLPSAKRLTTVIEKVNTMHYDAHWEAGAEGPRIVFGHCPYAAIIERHPELCQIDTQLLRTGIGMSADQLTKIGTGGATTCIFVLGKRRQSDPVV